MHGVYGSGNYGESRGQEHIIHVIPCTKRGDMRDRRRLAANPPLWYVPLPVHPGPPTGPIEGIQLLPWEGTHCHEGPEHGKESAPEYQESTYGRLSGLFWVGGTPWPFQAAAAVPPPTDMVAGPTG